MNIWYADLPPQLIHRLKTCSDSPNFFDRAEVLSSIYTLNLSSLGLTEIPSCVYEMSNLNSLDLSDNYIGGSPNVKGLPQSLRELDISENEVIVLDFEPVGDKLPPALTQLYAHNNLLFEMPVGLMSLASLALLSIDHNFLEELDLCTLPSNLIIVKAGHNNISKISCAEVSKVRCSYLDISNNKLENLPANFWACQTLSTIVLTGNNWKEYPYPELAKQGLRITV